jgi:hypothetical protein
MELYIEELKLLETETKDLLQNWDNTATTPVEKANFVKTYQDVIYRLFTRFNSLNDKVLKALNVKNSYSEMSRDEVSKTLKRGQRRQVTKECSCNPCTKIPCLDNQVWANEFWKFISCGACCACYHNNNSYRENCYCKATASTLGLYPALMGVPYLATHLIQGLGFLITLPCRPKCSLEETKTTEEYTGPFDTYLKHLVSKIQITLTHIEAFKQQRKDSNTLPVAAVVTLKKPEAKDAD